VVKFSVFEKLENAVIEGSPEKVAELTKKALNEGFAALEIIEKGLAKGVREVGERFGRREFFLVELILAGESMKTGLDILRPVMKKGKISDRKLGKVLIGTVKGDIHSIGKDIVATLLEAEGFEVYNLGEDVSKEMFLEKVKELNVNILGLSSLMTITMPAQREIIETLEEAGIRDDVKVMIGGAPTSQEWAEDIGADAWAGDAVTAVRKAKQLIGEK
jgi:corrinoid protein of di/trimethylamine methyltransferase